MHARVSVKFLNQNLGLNKSRSMATTTKSKPKAAKQPKKSKSESEPKEPSAKNAIQIRKGFLESLTQELLEKGTVKLTNFGVFSVKTIAGRTRRNPKTGETFESPDSYSVKFSPSKNLKELVVNSKKQSE